MATRTIRDVLDKVTKACPAANANHDSSSIDLGAAYAGVLEKIEVEVDVPATTALVADKDLTITLQDSADNSTFAAIEELAPIVLTGANPANGSAALVRKFRLPSSTKRYLNMNIAVENGGGDNTAKTIALSILT